MYKVLPGLLLLSFTACTFAGAQSTDKEKTNKEKKEIIIEEKSSGKNDKMVIVVDGDKVIINGKPSDEYKGDKHIVIDDDILINGDEVHIPRHGNMYLRGFDNRAMLGVMTEKNDKGALIKEVIKESAAEKAGLKAGDIITKVNNDAVASHEDLVKSIGKMKPDDVADITYLRNGKTGKVKATLGKSNAPNAMSWDMDNDHYRFNIDPPMAMMSPGGPMPPFPPIGDDDMWMFREDRPKYGMSIEDYADGDGVKVTGVEDESSAAKSGLKENDIIVEADGKAVKGVDDLRNTLKESKEKSSINIKVQRNGSTENLTLKVPKIIKKAEL
jgi:serine protease Do